MLSVFEELILNSPYDYPDHHWEPDPTGQPTSRVSARVLLPNDRDSGEDATEEKSEV